MRSSIAAGSALLSLVAAQGASQFDPTLTTGKAVDDIPVLGFGTWSLSKDDAGVKAVANAIKLGYRSIDAATAYQNQQWVGMGIDGWRLDVANEVDHAFWREFCKLVRELKPDIFILGEFWHNALGWISSAKFDSAMHYPLLFRVSEFFFDGSPATRFANDIVNMLHWYPETVHDVLFTLLGTHDTARLLNRAKDDLSLTKLCFLFQFTHPGTPCIYYGDEIGMSGEYDPGCRRCMEWDPKKQNRDLFKFVQFLVNLRKTKEELITGLLTFLEVNDKKQYIVYRRSTIGSNIVVALSLNPKDDVELELELGADVGTDLESGKTINFKEKKLIVPHKSFRLIHYSTPHVE